MGRGRRGPATTAGRLRAAARGPARAARAPRRGGAGRRGERGATGQRAGRCKGVVTSALGHLQGGRRPGAAPGGARSGAPAAAARGAGRRRRAPLCARARAWGPVGAAVAGHVGCAPGERRAAGGGAAAAQLRGSLRRGIMHRGAGARGPAALVLGNFAARSGGWRAWGPRARRAPRRAAASRRSVPSGRRAGAGAVTGARALLGRDAVGRGERSLLCGAVGRGAVLTAAWQRRRQRRASGAPAGGWAPCPCRRPRRRGR